MPNLQMQNPKSNSPTLLRQIGLFSATALVISNMIGMGIFITTGYMASALGSATLILACWGVGALFALAGEMCIRDSIQIGQDHVGGKCGQFGECFFAIGSGFRRHMPRRQHGRQAASLACFVIYDEYFHFRWRPSGGVSYPFYVLLRPIR